MDDPWGSPWAEEAQFREKDEGIQKKDGTRIADVPAAAAKLDFGVATGSPWGGDTGDEEDDFGEWSSMPANTSTMIGNEDFETNLPMQHSTPTAIRQDDTSPKWVHTRHKDATPSEAGSSVADAAFQASPDPWNEVSIDDSDDTKAYFHSVSVADGTAKSNYDGSGESRRSSVSNHTSESYIASKAREQEAGEIGLGPDGLIPAKDYLHPDDQETTPASPTSLTSQSDGSHHEDAEHHETPRTSSDDEHNRPPMPRKVSSRIKPLIEHFDGLSKEEATSEPPATLNIESAHDVAIHRERKSTTTAKQISTSNDPKLSSPLHDKSPSRRKSHSRHSSSVSTLSPDIDPNIGFEVDITILDQLFPPASQKADSEDIFIPDVVPYESFTSMEQRKTWYRISRYGSMRKHDSGDDDAYTRIMWMVSRVHDETIKVVARWMEEDRLSGQVMLGGTGRTSALFGWGDAKAPAVSLDAVFAARHNKRQSMTVNGFTSTAATNHRALKDGGKENNERTGGPVASLGWSNDSPVSSTTERAAHALQASAGDRSPISLPVSQPPAHADTTQGARSFTSVEANPSMPVEQPRTSHDVSSGSQSREANATDDERDDEDNEDEDEDGWGEMVSMPVVQGHPASTLVEHSNQVEDNLAKSAPFNAIPIQPTGILPRPGAAASQSSMPVPSDATVQDTIQISGLAPASIDSWASSDFSSFGPAPKHPLQPTSAPLTILPPASPVRSKATRPSPLKQVTFSTASTPSHSTHSGSLNSRSSLSRDEDIMYKTIIEGLPDLSYMLKR